MSSEVHKFARNAVRRYRRLLGWLESPQLKSDAKAAPEAGRVSVKLAGAIALAHRVFHIGAEEVKLTPDELAASALRDLHALRIGHSRADTAGPRTHFNIFQLLSANSLKLKTSQYTRLQEARDLLKPHLAAAETAGDEEMTVACLKVILQICIQAEDGTEGRPIVERLIKLRPEDIELQNQRARLTRMEAAVELKKGGNEIEDIQKELQASSRMQRQKFPYLSL